MNAKISPKENGTQDVTMIRETEKAILVSVEYDSNRRPAQLWFPKSQIEMDGTTLTAPVWLWAAKARDKGIRLTICLADDSRTMVA